MKAPRSPWFETRAKRAPHHEVFTWPDLPLLEPVLRHIAAGAVVFVWQEFAGHRDLDAVALGVRQTLHHHVEIDRRHDAVAELLLDQRFPGRAVDHHELVEAIDQGI